MSYPAAISIRFDEGFGGKPVDSGFPRLIGAKKSPMHSLSWYGLVSVLGPVNRPIGAHFIQAVGSEEAFGEPEKPIASRTVCH